MTIPTTSPAERLDCDDSSLVALAKAGNMPAIDRLVHRYRPEAYRAAARIVRCHEDAEEVAQDALWAAIDHLSTFRQDAPHVAAPDRCQLQPDGVTSEAVQRARRTVSNWV